MRNIFIGMLVILLLGLNQCGFCQDIQDIEGRWALGLGSNYVQPEDAEYEDNPTVLGKVTLGYGVTNNLGLELEWNTFGLESKTGSEVRVNSLFINTELRTIVGKVFPYALFGLGWSFFSFENLTPAERKDKSNSYAYKMGVGLEYFLNQNWALNYEVVHFYTDTGKTNLDVYNWQHGISIKYYF